MLKAVLDSLDGVEETYHGLYEQDGEVYRLKVDGVVFEDQVSGLKSALDKERDRRRELVSKLEKISATQSMSVEEKAELDKLRAELEEREMKDLERRGEFDRVKQTIMANHEEEMRKVREELMTERNIRIERDRNYEATAAVSEYDGHAKLILPVIEKQTKYLDLDGVSGHYAIDDKGEVRYTEKGKPMGIFDLVRELRDDEVYGMAFKPTGKQGTESPTRRVFSRESDPSKMTKEQKIQVGLENLKNR